MDYSRKGNSTDRAHNIIATASHLPFEHVACITHSLQRSITIALDDALENVLAKCRKLVDHFKHNPVNSTELKIQQAANGQKQEPLVQDISTRWNPTLGKVQFMLRNKAAVTATLALRKHNLSVPPDDDFEKLQKLETLLEPCRVVTEFLGWKLYVSCSMVLSAFCHLFHVMAVSDDNPAC